MKNLSDAIKPGRFILDGKTLRRKRVKPVWNYDGDIDLKCGGLFWREEESPSNDYVSAVEVTPCSDAGGPDNLFHIVSGSIYISNDPETIKSALSVIDQTPETASRRELVQAFRGWHGMEFTHKSQTVRIGPIDPYWRTSGGGWNPTPDKILQSNAKLSAYVKKEFLS